MVRQARFGRVSSRIKRGREGTDRSENTPATHAATSALAGSPRGRRRRQRLTRVEVRAAAGEEPTCRPAIGRRQEWGPSWSCSAASGLRAPSPQLVGFPPSALPPEGPRRHPVRASRDLPLLPGRSSGAGLFALAGARGLLHLWLSCLCVSLRRDRLRQPFPELRWLRRLQRASRWRPRIPAAALDQLSEHMLRLYDRYSGGGVEEARTPGTRSGARRLCVPPVAARGQHGSQLSSWKLQVSARAPFPLSCPRVSGTPRLPRLPPALPRDAPSLLQLTLPAFPASHPGIPPVT